MLPESFQTALVTMEFLNDLNTRQREAVTSTEGRIRVIAGAGTGKTKALTYRYAYIVNELGIDPATKQVCYSNGLNIDRAVEIHRYVAGRLQDSYGVGTFLTCDVVGAEPMNIVLKLTRGRITELREWHDCVKLSCTPGKTLGNKAKCDYLLSLLK